MKMKSSIQVATELFLFAVFGIAILFFVLLLLKGVFDDEKLGFSGLLIWFILMIPAKPFLNKISSMLFGKSILFAPN